MIRLLVLLAEKLNFTLVIKASVDVFLRTVFKLTIVKLRSRSRLGPAGQKSKVKDPVNFFQALNDSLNHYTVYCMPSNHVPLIWAFKMAFRMTFMMTLRRTLKLNLRGTSWGLRVEGSGSVYSLNIIL